MPQSLENKLSADTGRRDAAIGSAAGVLITTAALGWAGLGLQFGSIAVDAGHAWSLSDLAGALLPWVALITSTGSVIALRRHRKARLALVAALASLMLCAAVLWVMHDLSHAFDDLSFPD